VHSYGLTCGRLGSGRRRTHRRPRGGRSR
jgi:hypothetical protein